MLIFLQRKQNGEQQRRHTDNQNGNGEDVGESDASGKRASGGGRHRLLWPGDRQTPAPARLQCHIRQSQSEPQVRKRVLGADGIVIGVLLFLRRRHVAS